MKLYHGTRQAYAADIEAHGLIPQGKPGADANWSCRAKWSKRKPAVYLTTDQDAASQFANYVAREYHDKPAVFEVDLPDAERGRLQIDEAAPTMQAYRLEGAVDPAWIRPAAITSHAAIGDGNDLLAILAGLLGGETNLRRVS